MIFFSLLLSTVSFLFPVSNTKQQKMNPEEEDLSNSTAKITDDLVVEILSRLPFKSFCRSKCVCKSWLAFSSDPHYSQKLPKVPTGFFYQDRDNSAVQFVSLSKNDEGIDGTLSFLPHYEQLKFIDCCNGLVLCEYRSSHTSPDIFRFIVCNPATREWRILPDTQRKSDNFCYKTMLCFYPSRSLHFCVFHFHEERGPTNPMLAGTRKVEMFSSRNSMWLVYSDLWDPEYFGVTVYCRPHLFLDGFLCAHSNRDVLVLEELVAENIGLTWYTTL